MGGKFLVITWQTCNYLAMRFLILVLIGGRVEVLLTDLPAAGYVLHNNYCCSRATGAITHKNETSKCDTIVSRPD